MNVVIEVERNVSEALRLLHSLGHVHCDVAPNNILRVGGVWKLADLDACRRRGRVRRQVFQSGALSPS